MNMVLEFLNIYFEKERTYSTINTARSALSALGVSLNGHEIGSHPTVRRFMKGVFNLRPPGTKSNVVWDVSVVLQKLRELHPLHKLSLKELTLKLTMLLMLTIAARTQTLQLLSLEGMRRTESDVTLTLTGLLKQSRPGYCPSEMTFKKYPSDPRICVIKTLDEYLVKTKKLRNTNKLLISYTKPYGPVTKDTISRWLRHIMEMSGININVFKVHSIRSASVSKAKQNNVPIHDILKTAGWSSVKTFAKFYDKEILDSVNTFQDGVLSI